MNPSDSFHDVMTRLRGGDDRAASELFQRYARRLVALARGRLEKAVQQKIDPEDVLQSVFRSFFARHAGGDLEAGNWDGLWTILTVITVRKCINQGKFFHRERRNVRRELAAAAKADTDSSSPSLELFAAEPTPDEAAVLAETVEGLMNILDPRDREILSLSLQGFSAAEIASQVGYAERTVRRALSHVRAYLERQRDEEE